jgi:hypothetical protein
MKYKLTNTTKVISGITLYQIVATTSFGYVREGELGGWIQAERNLSHSGDAWVSGDAQVYGDAQVFGDAWVSGDAQVYGDAQVLGNAQVSGNARVYGDARVSGDDLVNIIGIRYPITVTAQHIQIGCKRKTLDEWMATLDQEGDEHGYPADDKDLIRAMLPLLHARCVRNHRPERTTAADDL